MTYDRIHVIAGSVAEATAWAEAVKLQLHQWQFLHNVKTTEGRWKHCKYAAVGTYRDRTDYYQVRLYVRVLKPVFVFGWEFDKPNALIKL